MARYIPLAILSLLMAACAPTHMVKPLPDFVEIALKPGDKVIVTTSDGTTSEFVVTNVNDKAIYGEQHTIPIETIVELRKKAWLRPKSPCGGEKPLGCSVPLVISLASESHAHYQDKFYDACAQHDYCYRHGHITYGTDRDACDQEFLDEMLASCPAPARNRVTKLLEILDDSLDSRSTCVSVAKDFHAVVRKFGEKKFKIEESTYCEYDGPPPAGN